jgi:hypothetical protein
MDSELSGLVDTAWLVSPMILLAVIVFFRIGAWKWGLGTLGAWGIYGGIVTMADGIANPELQAETGMTTFQTAMVGMCVAPAVMLVLGIIGVLVFNVVFGEGGPRRREGQIDMDWLVDHERVRPGRSDDAVIAVAEIVEQVRGGHRQDMEGRLRGLHIQVQRGEDHNVLAHARYLREYGGQFGVSIACDNASDEAYISTPSTQLPPTTDGGTWASRGRGGVTASVKDGESLEEAMRRYNAREDAQEREREARRLR